MAGMGGQGVGDGYGYRVPFEGGHTALCPIVVVHQAGQVVGRVVMA